MTEKDDHRLVEHLYGELSEEDSRAFEAQTVRNHSLASTIREYRQVLDVLREEPDADPPSNLDALILAQVREEAERLQSPQTRKRSRGEGGFGGQLRELFVRPWFGLAALTSSAVAIAVILFLFPRPMVDHPSPPDREPAMEVALAPLAPPPSTADELDAPRKELESESSEHLESAEPSEPERAGRDVEESKKGAPANEARMRKSADEFAGVGSPAKPKLSKNNSMAQRQPVAKDEVAKREVAKDESIAGKGEVESKFDEASASSGAFSQAPNLRSDKGRAAVAGEGGAGPGGGRGAVRMAPSSAAQDDEVPGSQRSSSEGADPTARVRLLIEAAADDLAQEQIGRAIAKLEDAATLGRRHPVEGEALLARARLERSQRRYQEALQYAKKASRVPRFRDRVAALDLVAEMGQALGLTEEVVWSQRERKRVVSDRAGQNDLPKPAE